MLDYHAVSDVVVPYRRISQSVTLMTAIGLGRPTALTPLDGLLERTRDLGSAVVAADSSGFALASSIVTGLQRADEFVRAAGRHRERLASAPFGWPSVGRATSDAPERGLGRLGGPA
jgi:hypothetical protein